MRYAALILMLALTGCNSSPSEADRVEAEANAKAERLEAEADALSAKPAQKAAVDEQIATVLNLNGLLCAKVVAVRPLVVGQNTYEVTCVEYRGGSGQVRYILDAAKGTAFKA